MDIKRPIPVAPVGVLNLQQSWQREQAAQNAFHEDRNRRIASADHSPRTRLFGGDQFEEIVAFLVNQGIPENQVRQGSIPLRSLEYLNDAVLSRLDKNSPLMALHIGNFVGVSLAYIAEKLKSLNPNSVTVAVDPNIPHRGVENPQSVVMKLMCSAGLERNVLMVAGFSLERNVGNEGTLIGQADPAVSFTSEYSCEAVLRNLGRLFQHRFDLVCLDGNHQADYLQREIEAILPLMASRSWIVLDDVDANWPSIREVFRSISRWGLTPVGTNGRIGIARRA